MDNARVYLQAQEAPVWSSKFLGAAKFPEYGEASFLGKVARFLGGGDKKFSSLTRFARSILSGKILSAVGGLSLNLGQIQ